MGREGLTCEGGAYGNTEESEEGGKGRYLKKIIILNWERVSGKCLMWLCA